MDNRSQYNGKTFASAVAADASVVIAVNWSAIWEYYLQKCRIVMKKNILVEMNKWYFEKCRIWQNLYPSMNVQQYISRSAILPWVLKLNGNCDIVLKEKYFSKNKKYTKNFIDPLKYILTHCVYKLDRYWNGKNNLGSQNQLYWELGTSSKCEYWI